jgi:hypothetical protein
MTRWPVSICALAIGLLAIPAFAQQRPPSGGGTSQPRGPVGRPTGPMGGPIPVWGNNNSTYPGILIPDNPPIPKPVVENDAKCLPWNVTEVQATTVSVNHLSVPSKARHEFEKACDANNKNKFPEAEEYARAAIDKFQKYSAAWVMLGVVLEEQHKRDDALAACARATEVDSTYLPGYLCKAEFESRNQDWEKVLNISSLALGLNSKGDEFAYYYRAMASFHLDNLEEAKKSALRAAELDNNHTQVTLYFLLAQIYEAQGDKINAAAQLRQILKHHQFKDQEVAAKEYLAKLESEPETN